MPPRLRNPVLEPRQFFSCVPAFLIQFSRDFRRLIRLESPLSLSSRPEHFRTRRTVSRERSLAGRWNTDDHRSNRKTQRDASLRGQGGHVEAHPVCLAVTCGQVISSGRAGRIKFLAKLGFAKLNSKRESSCSLSLISNSEETIQIRSIRHLFQYSAFCLRYGEPYRGE